MAQVLYEEGQPMPVVPPVRGWRWASWRTRPCGTAAAYRRHLRHSEPDCPQCLEAERIRSAAYRDAVRRNGGPLGGRWPNKTPGSPG